MNREHALLAVRDRFGLPLWALIGQLEKTLSSLAKVEHVDIEDPRAIGSVLNSALRDAAQAANSPADGLSVEYVDNGRSNKIVAPLDVDGKPIRVCLEVHVASQRGKTSKARHQFAGRDIEVEPALPGFVAEAPKDLLFFLALNPSGTGASIHKAFLKYADGIDQRMIELFRPAKDDAVEIGADREMEGPAGSQLRLKSRSRGKKKHGSTSTQRGDAASGTE